MSVKWEQYWGSNASPTEQNFYKWSALAVDFLRGGRWIELTVQRNQFNVERVGITPSQPAIQQETFTLEINDPVTESPYTFWGRVSDACAATTQTFILILRPGAGNQFLIDSIKIPVEFNWQAGLTWFTVAAQVVEQHTQGYGVRINVDKTQFSPAPVGTVLSQQPFSTPVAPGVFANFPPQSPYLFWGEISYQCAAADDTFSVFLAPGSTGTVIQPAIKQTDIIVMPNSNGNSEFWKTFRDRALAAQATGGSVTLFVNNVQLPVVGVPRTTTTMLGADGRVNNQTFGAEVFPVDMWNQISSAFKLSSTGGIWHFANTAKLPVLTNDGGVIDTDGGGGGGDGSNAPETSWVFPVTVVVGVTVCIVLGAVVYSRRTTKRSP
jgi:hypothetical protein